MATMCAGGGPFPVPTFAELEGLLQRHKSELQGFFQQWADSSTCELQGGSPTSAHSWALHVETEDEAKVESPTSTLTRDCDLRILGQAAADPTRDSALESCNGELEAIDRHVLLPGSTSEFVEDQPRPSLREQRKFSVPDLAGTMERTGWAEPEKPMLLRKSRSRLSTAELHGQAEAPQVQMPVPIRFSRNFGGSGSQDKTPQNRRWQHMMRGRTSGSHNKTQTPLGKKKMERMLEDQSELQRFTNSSVYEFLEASAITLNVAFIAYETGQRAWLASRSDTFMDVARGEVHWNLLNDLFCLLFATDLVLRIRAESWDFFQTRERIWNIFDIVVVGTTILESCARWHQFYVERMTNFRAFAGKFVALRIVRVLRIVRSTRAIRASPFIRELSIMVCSLTGAWKPFLWSVVLLCAVLLIFSVFFVDGTITFALQLPLDAGVEKQGLARFFGTLTTGTTSLLMAMTGGVDWEEIWQALQPLPMEYRWVYLGFITFGILALLNVVTAVFVETAMQRSQNDQEFRLQTEVERKVDFVQSMQRVFEELDTNGSGTLTLQEFERQMEDENVLTFMSTMELDIDQVKTLLTLLDRDMNGEVDIDEFIAGCIRLKGGAKSLDMAILQYQVEWMLHNVASLHQELVGRPVGGIDLQHALSATNPKIMQSAGSVATLEP